MRRLASSVDDADSVSVIRIECIDFLRAKAEYFRQSIARESDQVCKQILVNISGEVGAHKLTTVSYEI